MPSVIRSPDQSKAELLLHVTPSMIATLYDKAGGEDGMNKERVGLRRPGQGGTALLGDEQQVEDYNNPIILVISMFSRTKVVGAICTTGDL